MKISELIVNLFPELEFDLFSEKEFDYLGLIESKTDFKLCTFLDRGDYIEKLPSNVRMVITKKEFTTMVLETGRGVLQVEEPRLFYFKLHNALAKNSTYCRKDFETQIDDSALISNLSDVARKNVIIGRNVIIQDGVEIQNNTCVDRAVYPWDNTVIGKHTKIDNLVHIGHGVKIAPNVLVVANSGIGGRTEIKNAAWIGFGATIRNGIVIGEDSRVNMGAVVTKNVESGHVVTGNFAIEHGKFMENLKQSVKSGGIIHQKYKRRKSVRPYRFSVEMAV